MKKIFLIFCLLFLFSCDLKKYETPKISWNSCKEEKYKYWFTEEIDENLLCSEFEVPLDYEKIFGKKITLALTKYPAKSEKPIGDLLIISGGPGDSSINSVSENLVEDENTKEIFKNFNIIGYSPRGVFPSNPQIDCGEIGNENSKEVMEKCIKISGKNFLKNISSYEAFEDVEQIRLGLGGEKISVVSYSYGTKILALYTEKYGKNLRAGVFDGIVDLNEDMFTTLENQEKGFQKTFENFVKFCLDYEDCLFNENDDYNKQFHNFLQNLEEKNFLDKTGEKIEAFGFLKIFQDKIMWDEYWEDLIVLMRDLNLGELSFYNEVLDEYLKNIEDENAPTDMGLSVINCADSSPKKIFRKEKEYIEKQRKIDEISLYDNFEKMDEKQYLDLCFYWPFDGKDKIKIPKKAKNSPQLVFVAQKFDPTTPYQNALNMAKYFSSPLLTRNQNGHTLVLAGISECIDKKIVGYLLNPKEKIENETCEK